MQRHFILLLVLATLWGCKSSDSEDTTADATVIIPCVPIAQTPLCWRLPHTWSVKSNKPKPSIEPPSATEEPAKAEPPPVENDNQANEGVVLKNTELLVKGQRKDTTHPTTVPPRLEVYRDKKLPKNASITDYLVANRMAQKTSLGDIAIRHLEVEPVRVNQRRGFHLRDAFDVPLPQGGKAPVSQQALILLDQQTGYVIAVTHMEDERARLAEELRALLGSVEFR